MLPILAALILTSDLKSVHMMNARQAHADHLLAAGRYAEAADAYQKLITLGAVENANRMALAWAYRKQGRLHDALDALKPCDDAEEVLCAITRDDVELDLISALRRRSEDLMTDGYQEDMAEATSLDGEADALAADRLKAQTALSDAILASNDPDYIYRSALVCAHYLVFIDGALMGGLVHMGRSDLAHRFDKVVYGIDGD